MMYAVIIKVAKILEEKIVVLRKFSEIRFGGFKLGGKYLGVPIHQVKPQNKLKEIIMSES